MKVYPRHQLAWNNKLYNFGDCIEIDDEQLEKLRNDVYSEEEYTLLITNFVQSEDGEEKKEKEVKKKTKKTKELKSKKLTKSL